MNKVLLAFVRISALLLLLATVPAPAHAGLTDGLVGYWTLDGRNMNWVTGTVTDSSGQGNNGKVVNMSTTTAPVAGKAGQTLRFNGTNQWISIGTNKISPLLNGKSAITMSAWIRASTTPGSGVAGRAASFFIGDDQTGALIGYSGPNYWVGGRTLSGETFQQATTTWTTPTQWHHLTGVLDYSNDQITIYVDGVLTTTKAVTFTNTTYTPSTPTSAYTDSIGVYGSFSVLQQYFGGDIDDARIYNRALSATEIGQLYNLGQVKFATSPVNALRNGLVRYWTFDGKDINWTTGTVNDATGQAHTGKLNGMSTTTTPTFGRIGQGLRFDATNDSIITTSNFSLPAAMTVSVWAKTPSPTHTGILLAQRDSPNNKFNFQFYMAGQTLVGRIAGTATTIYIGRKTGAVIDKNWHLYTMTWDGGTTASSIKLYIDGVQSDTTDDNGGSFTTPSVNSFQIEIGSQNLGVNNFDGVLDDARIYNRALSAQEVRQLYSAGSAKQSVSPVDVLKNGLVGYWTMDGKNMNWTTGTVGDISGQGNNGKVVSMSTTTSPVQGKIGQALSFNGAGQCVITSLMTSQVNNTTFSFWAKLLAATDPRGTLLFNGNGYGLVGGATDCLSTPSEGTFCFLSQLQYWNNTGVSMSPYINKWHHYAYTLTGSGTTVWRLYIDGVLMYTSAALTTPTAPSGASSISGEGGGCGNSIPNYMDDVRVYNRALSAQEVRQLYNLGRSTAR